MLPERMKILSRIVEVAIISFAAYLTARIFMTFLGGELFVIPGDGAQIFPRKALGEEHTVKIAGVDLSVFDKAKEARDLGFAANEEFFPEADGLGRCKKSPVALELVGTIVSSEESESIATVRSNDDIEAEVLRIGDKPATDEALVVTAIANERLFFSRQGAIECLAFADVSVEPIVPAKINLTRNDRDQDESSLNGKKASKYSGQELSNPEKALELYQQFRNSKNFEVKVIRNGKPQVLSYSRH
jgi:type II secretory pathway component PulC